MDTFTTREQWLVAATAEVATLLAAVNATVPAVKVSVGFPSRGGAGSKGAKVVGQCFAPAAAADGVSQVFIHPVLSDPVTVLGVLTHELIHAAVGVEAGHKGPFKKVFRAVGMDGKPTESGIGEALKATFAEVVERLGAYPHAALSLAGQKKQSTRMLKAQCEVDEYTVRLTKKWAEMGLPRCGICGFRMAVEGLGGEDEDE